MSAHKITKTATKKFSIITMLEYDCATQETAHAAPGNQPTFNPPTLLYKKEKNIKKPRKRMRTGVLRVMNLIYLLINSRKTAK